MSGDMVEWVPPPPIHEADLIYGALDLARRTLLRVQRGDSDIDFDEVDRKLSAAQDERFGDTLRWEQPANKDQPFCPTTDKPL